MDDTVKIYQSGMAVSFRIVENCLEPDFVHTICLRVAPDLYRRTLRRPPLREGELDGLGCIVELCTENYGFASLTR